MEHQSSDLAPMPPPACQVCGRQDETLRVIAYPYIISLIFVTFWRGFAGLWCKRHRRRFLFLSSLITSTLGWLGIPYGLISTPVTLFKLAKGGNIDPQLNFQMLVALAEHKLQAGDSQGAIRCFEESLKFQDQSEVRQKLLRLYQQVRLQASENVLGMLARFLAIPSSLLMATVTGLVIGAIDIALLYLLYPIFGTTESIFLAILSWLPLVVMIFLGILFIRSGTEWALSQIRSENKLLGAALAVLASGFAFLSILEARAILNSLPSLITAYYFSIADLIFNARAILTYGAILELINFYQVQQAFGIIYIVLCGAGTFCSLYVGIDTAWKHAGWQTRLADLRRSLSAASENSSNLAWIWLSGIAGLTLLLVIVLWPGRFVNVAKANEHIENANFAMDNNDVKTALPELEQALAIWPENVRGHTTLGLIYFGEEDYELAFAEAESALSQDPDSPFANLLMGLLRTYRLESAQAIEHLKIATTAQPAWGTPHAYLALLYYQSDQNDLLQRELEMALAYEEGDAQTSFLIGAYYLQIQEYEESEKHLLKAAEIPPLTAENYFWLARLYAAQRKFDQAQAAIDKASALDVDAVDLHLAKADLFLLQENLDDALSEMTEALKAAPEDSYVHSDLSYVYFQQGRFDEAAKEAELALAADPLNMQGYLEQAFAYHAQEKMTEALAAAEKAVTFAPKNDRAHYILGLCYMERDMNEEAILEFEEFLDLYWDRAYVIQYKENAEGYIEQLRK